MNKKLIRKQLVHHLTNTIVMEVDRLEVNKYSLNKSTSKVLNNKNPEKITVC